jgi:radical SAM superfamily enzyme YgiQ (UPF0313 family)
MNRLISLPKYNLTLQKKGSTVYTKMSYPVHCGLYSVLETDHHVFHFNLNNEIIRAKAKGDKWGHPHEWLKRTLGNDWVFYSTGGYTGVFEATGEYYLPNFRYPSNSLLGGHPFRLQEIHSLADSWHQILMELLSKVKFTLSTDIPGKCSDDALLDFLNKTTANSPDYLENRARRLFDIIGGRISVLPPDARHVDYNLIPLTIAQGCLYKCRFCKVKNAALFAAKNETEIRSQICNLKDYYGADLKNYNSLFLGEHDALLAGADLITCSIEEAYREFNFSDSYPHGSNVFLFGSVTSFLEAPEKLFQDLEQLPPLIYINIGLESADQETLDKIGKPISARQVQQAFDRIQDINTRYSSIEITANFLMDDTLPKNHYPRIIELIRDKQTFTKPKGTIYFSPLTFDKPSRARLFEFHRLKIASKFPTYLYIIQRL